MPDSSSALSEVRHTPEALVVTGLSGAGKSTVLQVFEDLSFFTADGLPPELIPEFFHMLGKPGMEHFRGIALGLDLKRAKTSDSAAALESLTTAFGVLRAHGAAPQLLFLEASAEALLRRYATTRRPHPLEREGLSLEQAMAEEARRLTPVRAAADLVLDTSGFSLHDLRRQIQKRWNQAPKHAHPMRVRIVSFGFKYGVPSGADLVFDVRFLPNPYFDEALRPLTGQNAPVRDYIFSEAAAREFLKNLQNFLISTLPLYDAEGRYRLSVAIGCTGGRHRSVAVAEAVARAIAQADYPVSLEHSHLALG